MALELGFRLYGVATIKEGWESRASIDKDTFALNLEELDGEADSGNYFCKVFDANDDSLFKRTLTVEGKILDGSCYLFEPPWPHTTLPKKQSRWIFLQGEKFGYD